MSKITVHLVSAQGGTIDLQCKTGQSLMKAATDANVDGIVGECGGVLTCATCHVYVREPFLAQLDAMTDDEDSMLDFAASPRRANSRLSCQVKLTESLDGLTVDLPDTPY
jgi:2Fe-2S ferredoxin